MGLIDVQRALARLSVDQAVRERFFADPAAARAELGLNDEDCRILAALPRTQVERFAQSLLEKRQGQIRRAIPMAARALGRRFAGLCEQYARESTARGSTADLDDPAGFVDALIRCTERIEPPWAIDLARYELAGRQAARSGRVPVVRFFRFPVALLALGRGNGEVAPRPTLAFWWRPSRRGRTRHVVISLPDFGLRKEIG